MLVARVEVHAPVTSFRHPFFVTGRQPTSLMPPPSTVLGHCASALGEWPDVEAFFFGIHFTFRSRAQDLEHQHITEALGTRAKTFVDTPTGPSRATTATTVQPVLRDFLFDVRMTLYLPPDLGSAFRAPVHTMVLGRSQDLAEVVSVDEVELSRPTHTRLAHTLLPIAVRPSVRFGSSVLLTRHISPAPGRAASFAQYIVLHEAVEYEAAEPGGASNRAFLRVEGQPLDSFWCDSTVVDADGFTRGVWLHRVID